MGKLLELLPPGSAVAADGTLTIAGCRADELAEEFGTPAMIVDESALRRRAREYRIELAARWPSSRVVFASKAFPCTAVQQVMVQEGLGLDVAGGGEIRTALKAGVDPARIVLHGNAKGIDELALAVRHGIGLVVVDGPDDVERLEELVPSGSNQDVLVRVIPGVTADVHAHVMTGHEGSKFGLAPPAAAELIARIERSDRITMRGLHVHIGSQILDTAPFARSVAPLAALGAFDIYDLGGGLGARYSYADQPPAVAEYLDALIGAAREHLPGSAQVIIEPGRSMVASAAVTLYRVTTVKRGAHTFVAVDGGMGDNLEVALFGQRFEAGIANRLDASDPIDGTALNHAERVVVVGRHCESGDVLIDGVDLVAPRVGDLLVVPATGAYCFTMANNYNGSRRIPVVFADDGAARLVVRRETWEELSARDVE
jgi:diaminopimelate decarboxylase